MESGFPQSYVLVNLAGVLMTSVVSCGKIKKNHVLAIFFFIVVLETNKISDILFFSVYLVDLT
jgi:hypothetical protein